ncbi:hypothetical protein BGW36DRAFT_354763 [Talaromyces proteolyticus]|uniref:Uncharacterized protein n=1 Tax=Talaromyces proteolyticus TaxID=1131652 RepID=A0AAD4KYL2_9EURO|nr:uncharacterized protein BGW36DRAFT_354763 [Talaromyces proteolyticus]KAH8703342.1 hypothetical protein BGW36DRAFT_354763 [Talaromyces proteolyticus]
MSWMIGFGQFLLLCLTVFGFKSLLLFSVANGFVAHTQLPHKTGEFLAPLSRSSSTTNNGLEYQNVPLNPWLLGISERMDRQNIDFLIFMWPFVDGTRPDAALVLLNFAGAAGAAWMLVVIESVRNIHRERRVLYYIFPWGYLVFHYSHAMVTPLYSIWNLFWSPLQTNLNKSRPRDYVINRVDTIALISSQALAYIVPLALFAAPVPQVLSVFRKQTVVAWYQPWSVWIAVTHFIVTVFVRRWTQQSKSGTVDIYKESRSNHRTIYGFAFGLTATPHIIVLSISLTALLYPGLYSPRFAGLLHPQNVFIPPSPWSEIKAPHLVEGCKWLLQWDYIIGSTAVLVWVLTQYISLQLSQTHDKRCSWNCLLWKIVIWTVLTGPTAAAIQLLWKRDEIIFDAAIEEAIITTIKKQP